MMARPGFFKIHRSIEDWKFWCEPNALAIWIHILDSVCYEDSTFMGVKIPKGCAPISVVGLAKKLSVSPTTVKKWIGNFRSDGQIRTKRFSRFTLIEVLNWGVYQGDQQGDHEGVYQGDQQGVHQGDHIKRSKEVKKLRNKNLSPKSPYKGDDKKSENLTSKTSGSTEEERKALLEQLKGETRNVN